MLMLMSARSDFMPIPSSVQRQMDMQMAHLPANLQKYQSGNTYIPKQAAQAMNDYMKKTMPAHMQQYVGSYVQQKVTAGLNSLDPHIPRTPQATGPAPNLMRRDHSAHGEQFSIDIEAAKAAGHKSLAFTPQYATQAEQAPMQQVTAEHNPYEFITSHQPPRRNDGSSKKQRIIFVLAGAGALLIVALLFMSLLHSGSPDTKADYVSLLQQQTELVRVSEIGTKKARADGTQNLAYIANYSLLSEQAELKDLAKKAGAAIDAKTLALGKNPQTDILLTQADQNNNFDAVFTDILKQSLQKYQQQLQKIYNESSGASVHTTLHNDFVGVGLLIGS